MKSFSYYFWLTILALLGPLVLPSQAGNCPNIPLGMAKITVKRDQVILHKEPSQDSERGVQIFKDNKLTVIDHTAKLDQSQSKDTYCWYLVTKVGDPNSGQYYIADSGIKEFSYFNNEITESTLLISSPNKDIEKLELKLNTISGDITKLSEMNNHFKFWFLVLGIVGCLEGFALLAIGYFYFNNQRQLTKKVRIEVTQIIDQRTQHLLTQISHQNTNQGIFYEKNKDRLSQIYKKLSNLEKLFYSSEVHQTIVKSPNDEVNLPPSIAVSPFDVAQLGTSPKESSMNVTRKEIDIIIDHFNNKNKDYFRDPKFQALTLTQAAIHGDGSRMDGRPIVQFELTESSNATYLKIEVDGEKFIFPNITSPHFHKIMNGLHEYEGIFSVPQGERSSLLLIKPAKLREVNDEIWEIEEPGKLSHKINNQSISINPTITQELNDQTSGLDKSNSLHNIQENISQSLEETQFLAIGDQVEQPANLSSHLVQPETINYEGIFSVPQGERSSLLLIKPTKLREVNDEIWEIEEPRKLNHKINNQSISINPTITQELNYQTPESDKSNSLHNIQENISQSLEETQFLAIGDQVEQPANLSSHLVQPETINMEIYLSLQEIIDRFNHQRPELFDDFLSIPLTLTSDSLQGKVDINNRRIVQLDVPTNISQANYLKFDLEQTAWLIPNIKSPYISKIMGRLSENPEVFIITSVSNLDSLHLKKPAKLKEISAGLWEIEEPGEFIK